MLLKETPIPREDPHPPWCWRWSQGVLHVRHAFYHRPSLIALFSIPSILTFARNLQLQHFYNIIIDTSHSFPSQNQFLIQDNLVGKFLFVCFQGQLRLDNLACHLESHILLLANDAWQCCCSVTGDMQVASSGSISDSRGAHLTLPPA